MPTLLTGIFAAPTRRPAPPPAERPSIEAKPFIPTAPGVAHTIADTILYVSNARAHLSAIALGDYARLFVHLSGEMQKLDEEKLPINMCPNKPQTFPNVIVELARLIPHDADGSLNTRKKFLVDGLARSLTLRANLEAFDTSKGLDRTGTQPSAAWVLRRAFRSFPENPQALQSFAYEIQAALPDSKWDIAGIYRDFQRTPKLRKSDAAAAAGAAPVAAPSQP